MAVGGSQRQRVLQWGLVPEEAAGTPIGGEKVTQRNRAALAADFLADRWAIVTARTLTEAERVLAKMGNGTVVERRAVATHRRGMVRRTAWRSEACWEWVDVERSDMRRVGSARKHRWRQATNEARRIRGGRGMTEAWPILVPVAWLVVECLKSGHLMPLDDNEWEWFVERRERRL